MLKHLWKHFIDSIGYLTGLSYFNIRACVRIKYTLIRMVKYVFKLNFSRLEKQYQFLYTNMTEVWESISLPNISTAWYHFKFIFQDLKYGYSDDDFWSLDDTIASYNIKMLKGWNELEHMGVGWKYLDPDEDGHTKNKHTPEEFKVGFERLHKEVELMIEGWEMVRAYDDYKGSDGILYKDMSKEFEERKKELLKIYIDNMENLWD